MTEGYKKSFNNIFGWKVVDGKVSPPDFDLPKCAWERINFFVKEYENGLTFEGALQFVMAHDEHECMVDYSIGGLDKRLPVTPEFEEWRDSIGDKNMELAVALIYGNNEKGVG